MKSLRLLFLISFVIGCSLNGCATDPLIQERMVIAPDTIAFHAPAMDSTVSITHTCSCPFSWNATISPASPWLAFPSYQSGDKSDVPISIDRTKLTADTMRAMIAIASNSYGSDTIVVTAIR